MDKVFLKDVLAEMRKLDQRKKPIPFTITVRSYNKQNSFGGKLCTYTGTIKKICILFIVAFNGKEVIY